MRSDNCSMKQKNLLKRSTNENRYINLVYSRSHWYNKYQMKTQQKSLYITKLFKKFCLLAFRDGPSQKNTRDLYWNQKVPFRFQSFDSYVSLALQSAIVGASTWPLNWLLWTPLRKYLLSFLKIWRQKKKLIDCHVHPS